jgi:hypothetical protein
VLRVSVASELEEVTFTARAAFSKRSWPFVLAMGIPWILAAGQRTISRMASMGSGKWSASAYYRFLSEGKWRMELLYSSLLRLILETFHPTKLLLVLDDTLCPKWGKQIYGTSSFFDHTHRPRPGHIWGHNWVVLAVVVGTGKYSVALPFWIGLYRAKKDCPEGQFRTRHEMAVGVLHVARALYPGQILLLADGAYANDSIITQIEELKIKLVSRLRSDASLRKPTPGKKPKGSRGRPATHGSPLPKLKGMSRAIRQFKPLRVSIYGKSVKLLVREFEAYWPAVRRVIKVVITRDPRRPKRIAYLFSTDVELSAIQVIESFSKRWTIEQLFSVAKNQMGLGTAEVRKQRSVLRHAALCMALITWTEIWAFRKHPRSWARSFGQKLASLRAETITATVFEAGPRTRESRRNAKGIGDLFTAATRAA